MRCCQAQRPAGGTTRPTTLTTSCLFSAEIETLFSVRDLNPPVDSWIQRTVRLYLS